MTTKPEGELLREHLLPEELKQVEVCDGMLAYSKDAQRLRHAYALLSHSRAETAEAKRLIAELVEAVSAAKQRLDAMEEEAGNERDLIRIIEESRDALAAVIEAGG